jgi:hypothetical protein
MGVISEYDCEAACGVLVCELNVNRQVGVVDNEARGLPVVRANSRTVNFLSNLLQHRDPSYITKN